MPFCAKILFALVILFASPLSLADIGYSQEELKALAKREQAVTEPPNHPNELAAIIERSQQHKHEALTMHQHLDKALQDSPLASVLGTPQANPHKKAHGVMAFVSLSMPDHAFQQLLQQSQTYQVPLIIRGVLPEGFVPTASRITKLLKRPDGRTINSGIAISPAWFNQFNITHVPAFVAISDQCSETHCAANDYDIVHGNISIPSALNILSQGDVGHIAQRVLQGTPNE
ncbi:type-F conjugative transfer system pilin assembly protein TrbC [Vibrio sp. 10N.222.54.A1]|uniref:Type-F conjugative transfer system pilin assembly protein TrbC n=3 Tax=Vibrio cyclitrophicus TaxID=47951 RepID=A0A7Z1MFR8_9VIBR|nr:MULTISPECIES: type-F conjugative transfer system pilin assembly protein TrbC [Vibrio]PMK82301.1 type-F conjugative transfer system pilin assembly protein TrbC [Vibrio sp. 10N.261.52.E5]PMP22838.1 type-F conjugative transfer system pilin assembly protein TrbC [Vibrio cyclitrophicus]PMP24873.1 type-F conjugative transfer system pilin assembly protein TrbC [Vibrio cyclitrophicus]TKF84916.1 type-F conjugative transfer system pilin assembly protein TrbC [Vibrio sp. F13]TKG00439.1 type-F conjugat